MIRSQILVQIVSMTYNGYIAVNLGCRLFSAEAQTTETQATEM